MNPYSREFILMTLPTGKPIFVDPDKVVAVGAMPESGAFVCVAGMPDAIEVAEDLHTSMWKLGLMEKPK